MATVMDSAAIPAATPSAPSGARVLRHAGIDRLFHWLTAAAVLTLMGTSLLPVLGLQFDWVVVHWISGCVLIALTLFHIVRALFWQRVRAMLWFSPQEVTGRQVGKYTVAQKLMHYAMTFMVLGATITGGLMLMKMDTPLWKRDPYTLSQEAWGIIYVIHGIAALAAVTLVMIHVYFSLIPQSRPYLRAMIKGWITRQELVEHHHTQIDS
jgi:cytochrome b subunit of formate dehydrogenase